MFLLAKGKNAQFGRATVARSTIALPGLSLSSASVPENSPTDTVIGTATPTNASNPGSVTIVAQTLTNGVAMIPSSDAFAVGAAGGATGTLNYEVTPSFTATFEYTDDNGTYQFVRTITITDVADGPTITGATTDLETMLGAPVAGTATTGDLRDLFVSPTSQTLSFAVSHGSVDVDGYSWSWTPSGAGSVTVQITATDEDGQSLQIEYPVDVEAANTAPTAGDVTLTFYVPPPAAGAPDAFTAGQWSVADDGTNGDATITITALPADNGSSITDLEYRANGGSAVSLSGTTTGTYGISGLTDGVSANINIRAVNANGAGTWSDTKAVTSTGIPAAFTVGMWTLTDLTTGGDARIAISSLPSANGSALTDLEYKKDAGAWTSLAGTTTGNYDLSDVFTDGVSANVLIRAVNANGNGADSDTKSVTTTAPAGGITGHDAPQVVITGDTALSNYTGDVTGRVSGEDVVIMICELANSGGAGGTIGSWTVTLDGVGLTPLDSESVAAIYPCGAIYRTTPSNTGDLTLSVTPGGNPRSIIAIGWRIAGAGSTVAADTIKNEGSNTSVSHPNGITTGANGNVVLSMVAIKGGDVTGLGVTGADGSSTGQTNTDANADLTYGYAYQTKDPAGSVMHAWSWTTADAYVAHYIELAKA